MTDNSSQNILDMDLSVNHYVSERIQSITKWTRFMGILSVVFLGLFVLIVLAVSTQLPQMNTYFPVIAQLPVAVFLILALFVMAIIGVLIYFLLRFAIITRRAIQLRNQEMLNKGLDSLKTYFAIYAVMAIIGVAFSLFNMFTIL